MRKYILVLIIISALITPMAATGDQDLLCSAISDDLSAAGGCVDDDGVEDAFTSTTAIVTLEIGNRAPLITLGGVLLIFSILIVLVIGGVIVLNTFKNEKK